MRSLVPLLTALGLLALSAACGAPPPPPEEEPSVTRADSVGMAMQSFDPSVFDTLSWESEEARTERGGLVFRISCQKCHGRHGRGDGRFVMEGDTLRPPSFLTPDWGFADAPMALRRYIFSGNVAGMPYWGLVGLKYSDIDAVAHFIETPLRAGIGSE